MNSCIITKYVFCDESLEWNKDSSYSLVESTTGYTICNVKVVNSTKIESLESKIILTLHIIAEYDKEINPDILKILENISQDLHKVCIFNIDNKLVSFKLE